MGTLLDWYNAHRTIIGLVVTALVNATMADAGVQAWMTAHPLLGAYAFGMANALGFGVFTSGKFKSDQYHQDRQAELK